MTKNEFLRERSRFFRATQRHPTKVTLHPADAADLLLVLMGGDWHFDGQGRTAVMGTTLYQSTDQDVGRAKFEREVPV